MQKFVGLGTGVLFLMSVAGVRAEDIHVVRTLPGYACMMLNLTPQQAIDPKVEIPLRAAPSPNAQVVGYAMPVVAVRIPLKPVNGFYSALFPNGSAVWISASMVRPYHSLGDPGAKCVPAVMSNGLQGFDYLH